MKKSAYFEECLSRELIYDGKIITVEKHKVKLPDQKETTREFVKHPGAVGIAAVNNNKEILMISQYRYALNQETLEIPAGKLDCGEKPEVCALRELREETGYKGELTCLNSIHTSPGFANEIIYLYLAQKLEWDPLVADDDEFLGVSEIPLETAVRMVYDGEIDDAKSCIAILLAARLI